MYNRYIPQPDGTYRRHRMNDPAKPEPNRPPAQGSYPPPEPVSPPKEQPNRCPPPQPECGPPQHQQSCGSNNLLGFFKNLLPQELDTADLLILLLLLLMAGDSSDDKNTALLTLALYFFL